MWLISLIAMDRSQGNDVLNTGVTHDLPIFLFGFLKDARGARKLAAATGSLQAYISGSGPGGAGGQRPDHLLVINMLKLDSPLPHTGSCPSCRQCTPAGRAWGCVPVGSCSCLHRTARPTSRRCAEKRMSDVVSEGDCDPDRNRRVYRFRSTLW